MTTPASPEPFTRKFTAFLRANRARLIDELVAHQVATVPRLAMLDAREIRGAMELFLEDAMAALEDNDPKRLIDDILTDLRLRFEEGFSLADYIRGVLVIVPLARKVVREIGDTDGASLAREFTRLEDLLYEVAAAAANVYVELVSSQLHSKNRELNRLNQELAVREKALSLGVKEAGLALQAANEFNRRVIDSLTSGLMAVDAKTLKVTLYTQRTEEILGIPAEAVLGHDIREAVASLGKVDLDLERVIQTVRTQGRLPTTKAHLHLLSGRHRSVYIRGERLFGSDGAPEGTVIVIDDVTERELLVESFARYVSRDVLTRLLARGEAMGLEGERRVCTILFADIRGFSTFAEKTTPEALHELLNSYFGVVIDAVFNHGGFIDKFVGDKVMAVFSSGLEPAASARAAADAAAVIHTRIAQLNDQRVREGRLDIHVGIGINTGEVILGNVGSSERMEFTAIGDVVNVADRVQGEAAGGESLASESTWRLLAGHAAGEDLGERRVKGRSEPIHLFRLSLAER